MLVAIAPITSAAAAARKTARKTPAHSTAARKAVTHKPAAGAADTSATKTMTTDKREKTESVSGYTTKSGKKVAPYKRRPAN